MYIPLYIMAVPTNALHHLDIRKRIYKKKEKFPYYTRFGRLVDKAVYLSAIILPLINIPQLYRIWLTRDVTGISLISWIGFSLFSMVWVTYGVLHKEKPIIFLNAGLFIIQVLIVVSVIYLG